MSAYGHDSNEKSRTDENIKFKSFQQKISSIKAQASTNMVSSDFGASRLNMISNDFR